MAGNSTGLYGTTTSNVTIEPNNNTGLYNTDTTPIPVNNNITVSGNITAGGYVSAVGNIVTEGYFIGDGSLLTNLPASNYSNANVQAFLPTYSGNLNPGNVSATGNITGAYILGNGSQLTNLPVQPGTYGNANVAAYLPTYTGNLTPNIVTANLFTGNGSALTSLTGANVTGTVPQANIVTNASQPNITSVGTLSSLRTSGNVVVGDDLSVVGTIYGTFSGNITGNLVVPGANTEVLYNNSGNAGASSDLTFNSATVVLRTTGNVVANNFVGNGSYLTGMYGNANVANLLPTYTGNIAAGNVLTNNYLYANGQPFVTSNYGNSNVASFLTTYTGNIAGANLSVFGNVTGSYIFGNGSQLTGLPATYGNANVAAYLPTYTGALAGANLSVSGNVTGAYIFGNGSQLTGLPATYGNSNVVTLLSSFGSNTVSTTGNITAGYLIGDGSLITNLPLGNYSNANVANFLPTYSGAITAATVSATGNITGAYIIGNGSQLTALTGANVTGTVANATYATSAGTAGSATTAGTVTGNAQANITSVGRLTSLSVIGAITSSADITGANLKTSGTTGNITGPNYVSANFFVGDGGYLTNVASSFGNANVGAYLTTYTGNIAAGNISATGNIAGNYILGNGSQLTGLPATYSNANVATFMAAFGSNTISTTGNITAGYFVGNGSTLTNITGANVSGTVANATYATSAGSAATATNAAHATVADSANAVAGANVTGSVAQANYANIANSVSGSNVSGSVAQANYANTANAVAGGNVSGQVANALVAGTVYTAAQPNITSVGVLSALSVTGNITTGGILTDGYYYANGTPFTGGGGSTYGDSNVNTLLAAWGSNTLSTTGNVSVSNLNMSGQIYDSTGVLQLNGSGNIVLVPVSSTQAYGNVNIIGGRLTADAVTYANTDGTNGQVLTTYGNGVTYFSTVSGGSGSPGGNTTEIQFNNAGSFAGNVAMKFDNTTGNITLGNIVTNTNKIQTVAAIDLPNVTGFGTSTAWRVLVGNGYNGSANSIYSPSNPGSLNSQMNTPRLFVADNVTLSNNGIAVRESLTTLWANLSANISNTNTRLSATRSEIVIGGGANTYAMTFNAIPIVQGHAAITTIGRGTNANLSAVGNIAISGGAAAAFNQLTVNQSSNVAYGIASFSQLNAADNSGVYGNIGNAVGYFAVFGSGLSNTTVSPTSSYASYYQPGATSSSTNIFGTATAVMGSIPRNAANYHAFRNDDPLAKSRLGSLDTWHEYTANVTSSGGSLTIDKSNAQVQQIYMTENVTTLTLSNFWTRLVKPNGTYVNQSDTVTLIVQQGATPYTFTMPTGTAYRYAGGANTVTSSANTTTMISITGTYNYNTAADQYLITISPLFS